jgi:hypothetical protein
MSILFSCTYTCLHSVCLFQDENPSIFHLPGLWHPLRLSFSPSCLALNLLKDSVISFLTVPHAGPSKLHLKPHSTDYYASPAFSCATTRRVNVDLRSWIVRGRGGKEGGREKRENKRTSKQIRILSFGGEKTYTYKGSRGRRSCG